MSFYSTIKTIYKTVLPKTVRKAIFRSMPKPLRVARDSIIRKLERSAGYDDIYDIKYFTDGLDAAYNRSCEVIAESIVKAFCPKSVFDVGCGRGQLLLALKKRGVICRGLEYSSVVLDICRQSGLDVTKFDIEHDMLQKGFKVDVVVSTEVAEHLPESCADRFVDFLCAISDNVLMTAAEPARTWEEIKWGHDHVNEQPKEYWIDKFGDRGFKYNEDISMQFRREWKEREVSAWYVRGLMVFRKEPCSP